MIKNYFKIALRTIKNHKGYSFINITGLAIGIACCILILLWANEELSYDRFHKNAALLYRVNAINETTDQICDQWQMPAPLSPALKDEIPDIRLSTRYLKLGGEWLVRYGDKIFMESEFGMADPDLFQMFTFPAVEGNLENALFDPHSVVITQNIADKYFPDEDPIGISRTMKPLCCSRKRSPLKMSTKRSLTSSINISRNSASFSICNR